MTNDTLTTETTTTATETKRGPGRPAHTPEQRAETRKAYLLRKREEKNAARIAAGLPPLTGKRGRPVTKTAEVIAAEAETARLAKAAREANAEARQRAAQIEAQAKAERKAAREASKAERERAVLTRPARLAQIAEVAGQINTGRLSKADQERLASIVALADADK